MSHVTPATLCLSAANIAFELRPYAFTMDTDQKGVFAATALSEPAHRVLKTLMIEVDGKPACAVLPSDKELNLKKAASLLKGKAAHMMQPAKAERLTGFRVGGISPLGQKKTVPTVVEEGALHEPYVLANGGQRGLLVQLSPADLVAVLNAVAGAILR